MQLLNPDIQLFINSNLKTNINDLALKKNPFPYIDYPILLNQISAKNKAKDKLPTWFETSNIIYPNKISIEQSSSEETAKYKAKLISGNSIIDLTGGFGVDDYYFSQNFDEVHHCEINEELTEIVEHNFNCFNIKNVTFYKGNSIEILLNLNKKMDWIYIDPSRRNNAKGKVFLLKDCLPNVPELLNQYFEFTSNILIKTAPILDISSAIQELEFVKEIHIVALKNEVKELLFILEKNYKSEIKIIAANIENDSVNKFETIFKLKYPISFSLPSKYLFEPNAAIMKSGNMDALFASYTISKLHSHTHLFTSENDIDFPGRKFEILSEIPYHKEYFKQIEKQKFNCSVRNFPLSVDEIKKKFKIIDGGSIFAFFTTNKNNEKIVLLCKKI